MFKLDFEKTKEPEIKLPTSTVSKKEQENSIKISSASLTKIKPLTVWITTNWKILQEMGILDHLTCLLRNLYAGQEATVRTRPGTMGWFKIELVSYASKAMLKMLQASLEQYMNQELPDVQAVFRKGRGTRNQITTIHRIIKKAREFQKNIYFCFID